MQIKSNLKIYFNSFLLSGLLIFSTIPTKAEENQPKAENKESNPKASKNNLEKPTIDYDKHKVSRITFTENIDELHPKTSNDAKEILFEAWNANTCIGLYSFNAANSQNRTVITNQFKNLGMPTFNPTDDCVFFSAANNEKNLQNGILMKINKSGLGGFHIIPLKEEGLITSIAISSENDIAFSQTTSKGSLIQIINMEKNYQLHLAKGGEINWSSDGKKLVFTSTEINQKKNLYMIDKDGSNLIQLSTSLADISSPCFSPNNQWVCFSGLPNNINTKGVKKETSSGWNIYLFNCINSDLVQITNENYNDLTPYWSNDGNIYFSSNRFGNYEIMKIQPEIK